MEPIAENFRVQECERYHLSTLPYLLLYAPLQTPGQLWSLARACPSLERDEYAKGSNWNLLGPGDIGRQSFFESRGSPKGAASA